MEFVVTWLLLLFTMIGGSNGQLPLSPSEMYNEMMALGSSRTVEDQQEAIDVLSDFHFDKSLLFSSPLRPTTTRSSQCLQDMQIIKENVKTSPWAMTYLDSWGAKPSGLAAANLRWLGDFDPCVAIKPVKNGPNSTFGPQYCLAGFGIFRGSKATTPKPNIFQMFPGMFFGMCIPDSCKPSDIVELLGDKLPDAIHFMPEWTHCVDTNPPFNTYTYIAIACYSTVALFLALGLVVDIFQRIKAIFVGEKPAEDEAITTVAGQFGKLLICCSPLTNFEKLFKPAGPRQSPLDLSSINGIRTLSLFWVILGHTYTFLEGSYDNTKTFFYLATRTSMQFVLSGYFAVDSFFFLSGFLAYWSLSKVYAKAKNMTFPRFLATLPYTYFHRYMRLTPALGAIILLDLGLWRYLYNGPLYFQATDATCAERWWTNLIYVNNFVDSLRECVAWSWYLANDMQFFLFVPFVVYAFVRTPVIGWILSGLVIVLQIVSSAALTAVEHLPLGNMPPKGNMAEMAKEGGKDYLGYLTDYYFKPYTRVGPYIVGVIACHLLVQHHVWLKRHVFSKVWISLVGWIISFGTMLAIVYGLADYYRGEYVNSEAADAVYNAISRIAWAIALSWLVMSAATKSAGLVADFLSWPVWAVSARLSYCAYLLHPLVIMFYTQTQRRPFHMTDINMIFIYVGCIFCTLICAVIFSLGFESPVIGLLQRI